MYCRHLKAMETTVEEQIAIARQKAGIPEDADDIVLERFEVVRHQ